VSPSATRRVAVALAALSVAIAVAGTVMAAAMGRLEVGDFVGVVVIAGTVYPVVGAFIIVRAAGNRVGWLLLALGILWAVALLVRETAWYGIVIAPGTVPCAALALWASNWIWPPGTTILVLGVPFLFPDGHLPSRRWRAAVIAGVTVTAIAVVGHMLAGWELRGDPAVLQGTFDASMVPGVAGVLTSVGDTGTFLLLPLISIPAVVVRYRRSRGIARLQMRWFLLAIAAFLVLVVGDVLVGKIVPAAQGVLSAVAIGWLPIAIGIAVLRYRLWEIDRLISRTIGWALVTGILVAVFVCVILGMQAMLNGLTQGGTLAVAASTLAVLALFQPLRRRVQSRVDRRFNRSRFDADATAAAFGSRLRDEIDMAGVKADVTTTVRRAFQPSAAAVWVRGETKP
jgi:hypothetical protein